MTALFSGRRIISLVVVAVLIYLPALTAACQSENESCNWFRSCCDGLQCRRRRCMIAPPTRAPTKWPTSPTRRPTRWPTTTLSPKKPPTAKPTNLPTTASPTTNESTNTPTNTVTKEPTTTKSPASPPVVEPTQLPTRAPTTNQPTRRPSTAQPTKTPTREPTDAPTREPTKAPTNKPTDSPTTAQPTRAPTQPKVDSRFIFHAYADWRACRPKVLTSASVASLDVCSHLCLGLKTCTFINIKASATGENCLLHADLCSTMTAPKAVEPGSSSYGDVERWTVYRRRDGTSMKPTRAPSLRKTQSPISFSGTKELPESASDEEEYAYLKELEKRRHQFDRTRYTDFASPMTILITIIVVGVCLFLLFGVFLEVRKMRLSGASYRVIVLDALNRTQDRLTRTLRRVRETVTSDHDSDPDAASEDSEHHDSVFFETNTEDRETLRHLSIVSTASLDALPRPSLPRRHRPLARTTEDTMFQI